MRKIFLLLVASLLIIVLFAFNVSAEEVYLTSAMHLGVNRTEVFDLDGTYYLADMKDSSKNFYLNFSDNLINNTNLSIYAKKNRGVELGVYAQLDDSGNSPFATFIIISTTGEWYNVTLNINESTNAIWIGEGTGSGSDPKDEFDYISAFNPPSDSTPPEIVITYPENTTYNFDVNELNYTISDNSDLDSCWYSIDLGITNSTPVSAGINWTGVSFVESSNTWFVYCNDSLGNLNNTESVSFVIEKTPPNITIASPANQTYNNNSILVHITYEESNIDSIWWDNGTDNTTYEYWLSPNFYEFPEGSSTILVYANDSAGNLNNTESVTFFVDTIVPVVNIVKPNDDDSFGAANNLALNFTADDSGIGIADCWYNINNANNVSINNCENTTFSVAGSGSYILELFANDTLGNLGQDSVSFSVSLGAPSISLSSPIDVYLNNSEVTFVYVPSHTNLNTCELWGNFTGEFILNQTNTELVSDTENYFYLDLIDGNYTWNIRCNDSLNNLADNGNKSFIIDTINPGLTLTQPTGTKSSRTVSASWSINDENTADCIYNVYRGESLEVTNTTIDCSSGSTSFSVTVDADFVFNFYVNDSAGNSNSSSTSFSVSTSSPPPSSGGGGGGGSSYVPPTKNVTGELELSGVDDVVIKPGESRTLSIGVKNSGLGYLNKCELISAGEASNWISGDNEQGLAAGQSTNFVFSVLVPDNAEAKDYGASVLIKCDEDSAYQDFAISVLSSGLKLSIKEIKQNGKKLDFSYLIENAEEENLNINVDYWLVDELNNKEAEGTDSFGLVAGEQLEKQGSLDLTNLVAGTYTLVIKSNSEKESATVQEQVIIGNTGLIGGAIFGQEGGRIFSIIFIIGLGLLVAFFVVKRIIKNVGKQDRTDFIRHKFKRR